MVKTKIVLVPTKMKIKTKKDDRVGKGSLSEAKGRGDTIRANEPEG